MSKEQIQLLVASAIEGHNNQKHVEHEVREAVASLLVPSLLIVGLALYISMLAVRKSPARCPDCKASWRAARRTTSPPSCSANRCPKSRR
jgi:hypothetical protein